MLSPYWESVEVPWGRPQLCSLEQDKEHLSSSTQRKVAGRSRVGLCTESEIIEHDISIKDPA